jgi:CubicO group peptidase (beta-lactamase class C family)
MTLTRRELLVGGAAAFTVLDLAGAAKAQTGVSAPQLETFKAIDAMVEGYMRAMNAPGLTLAIADRGGVVRVATYGLSDLTRNEPVRPDHLFQIGSISKSFTAAALLQLRDEGKIDLHAPVTKYLPWLRIEPRDVITTHHLLTHSSGLPSWAPVFPTDPAGRHVAGFKPGSEFWYCNVGYHMLGYLIETLDGRPYPEAIRARIFQPLGMTSSVAYIAHDTRARSANSYLPYLPDRPHSRVGRLADAPQILMDNAAGSISSTPGDMALYLNAVVNRGKRILGEKSFEEWVTGYVPTSSGGAESYGYGWFAGKLDEHRMVRHTGGMVSFMSAAHIDLDDGIGAFASVNAQLGYRPNPVTTYAIRAVRAARAGQPLPAAPPIPSASVIPDAKDLAGVYTSSDGDKIEFVADGEGLVLLRNGKRHPVEFPRDLPIVRTPEFELFPFLFDAKAKTVAHGGRLWMGEQFSGEKKFTIPEAWKAFLGHYRSDSPWVGSTRVIARQGQLWLDGLAPMKPVDANTFRIAEPEHCPEWVQFLDVVNGKSRHIKISGEDLYRVEIP